MGKPKGESRGLEFLKTARPKAIENLLAFFAESARHLDPKTRFLISVVTKVIAGSERGIQQYVRRALESGASADEVIDAVLCAYPCAGLTKVVDAIDTILDMGIGEIALPGGVVASRETVPAEAPEALPLEASPVATEAAGAAVVSAVAENGPAAPEEAEPSDAVPTDAVPTDTVPTDTVPTDTVPTDTVPTDEDLTWIPAGQVADIPPISGRRVIAGDEDIAIFCVEGEVLAIENRCPHKGGSLSEGVNAEGIVTCPLHQWRFDLRSGQCPERPKAIVRTYPVRREGDQIFVGI